VWLEGIQAKAARQPIGAGGVGMVVARFFASSRSRAATDGLAFLEHIARLRIDGQRIA
jgi:hypothetical protein